MKPASQWKIATKPSVQTPTSNTTTSQLKTASNFKGLAQWYTYLDFDKDEQLNITFLSFSGGSGLLFLAVQPTAQ